MSERPTQADIEQRIAAYLRQLAPHQHEREAAILLKASKEEIASLKAQLAEAQNQKPVCYWYPIEHRYFSAEDAARYFDEKELKLAIPLYAAPTYKMA